MSVARALPIGTRENAVTAMARDRGEASPFHAGAGGLRDPIRVAPAIGKSPTAGRNIFGYSRAIEDA